MSRRWQNGCTYCSDIHTKDARAARETEQLLYLLFSWSETPFFAARERAALAWIKALTNTQQRYVCDEVHEQARGEFDGEALLKLTWAVTQINSWNRIALAFRAKPGIYQPATRPTP
jgi:alkylhydroperoxidase family enzyme